jgi:hypothetical protein
MRPFSFIIGSMNLILVAMKRLSWDSLFRREQVLMKALGSGFRARRTLFVRPSLIACLTPHSLVPDLSS